ncbi:hypothetical protein KDX15_31330 [Burkholderia cenocepacia]|uniref:hypothetical protein n=1 Tax=Burkholderia cepacia complex TaxID=87882 RepID=UPI001B8E65C1|nr:MULTISPECIES: hypothetical protein [Burkholderia cepacia complex]MBR8278345.1 hypothetical protein [Burkholderia cenocepacia]UEP39705.1 hypothetical protein LL998_33745 [Burkholderia ambifaria]
MFKVPKVLYADRRAGGVASDAALTHHATRMLHRVARDLRLRAGEHEVVAEPAKAGRGCRVTLRTSRMMLEVADSSSRQQVAVSFRTRRGHHDLSGGGDNVVPLAQLDTDEGYQALLGGLRLVDGLDSDRR